MANRDSYDNPRSSTTVTFTSNVSSEALLHGADVVGIYVPASFGASSITLTGKSPGGNSAAVNTASGTPITLGVDASTAGIYDLTDVFPTCINSIILNASVADGTEVELILRGAMT